LHSLQTDKALDVESEESTTSPKSVDFVDYVQLNLDQPGGEVDFIISPSRSRNRKEIIEKENTPGANNVAIEDIPLEDFIALHPLPLNPSPLSRPQISFERSLDITRKNHANPVSCEFGREFWSLQ
jgi:hypothetical protein